MRTLYIIESRKPNGELLLSGPQPEEAFGMAAITGISDWEMSRVIYAKRKDVDGLLRGDNIAVWPKLINENWIARVKTW